VVAPSDKVSAERDPFEYGLADEKPSDFANENVTRLKSSKVPLHIQTARKTIPWDVFKGSEAGELKKLEEWLSKVEADHLKPYVTLKSDEIHGPPSVPAYRTAMRNLIKRFGHRVKRWGAWNEPDLGKNHMPPERAGQYWQAAKSVAVELHCHCTIVAGEFAQYETDSENKNAAENRVYVSKYKRGLLTYYAPAWEYRHKPQKHAWENNKIPGTWGFHDYADVVNIRDTNVLEFEQFASGKLGKPRIWISEAGVLLHTGGEPGAATRLVKANDEPYEYEQQSKAANTFLELRHATKSGEKIPRIERVYYYTYEAPSEVLVEKNANEFDSGLFEAKPENKGKSYGEARPAYCYLAYENHDCPPTVKTVPLPPEDLGAQLEASVNPHGIPTTVEMHFSGGGCGGGDFCGGEFSETLTDTISTVIIHPKAVSFSKRSCPGSFSYYATAENSGGTAAGAAIKASIGCI
jgi:hypothetical protein